MQGELTELVDNGVSGVSAALIADYHIIIGADEVDHTALALVAPVDSYDRTVRHFVPPVSYTFIYMYLISRFLSPGFYRNKV